MTPGKSVRFGAFEADVSTGELRKYGTPLRLQDQPAKLLCALLENPGEVVSREQLVKLLWPEGTFVDYDRGLNAAVNRLRQALSDSAESPRYVETVARHGYRFIATVETAASQSEVPVPAHVPNTRKWILAAGVLLLIAGGWWLRLLSKPDPMNEQGSPVPLTSYEGIETHPSFSPDGSQVAFSWNGPNQDNNDIYVKTIGSDPPLRLTTDPAADGHPAWSPDGMQIAFHRADQGIFLVAPTGGPERNLVATPVFAGQLSWSTDGRYVGFARAAEDDSPAGIFLVDVRSGAIRRLTRSEGAITHRVASFGPDGKTVAFASCKGVGACGLFLMEIDNDVNPRGDARLRWQGSDIIQGITWTADSGSIVISEYSQARGLRLSRMAAHAADKPRPLEFAAPGSACAALSVRGNRLSYSSHKADFDLWQYRDGKLSRNSASSTLAEGNPQYSPDGMKVAFASTRSGPMEVWVAKADSSGAVRLTTSRSSGSPRWSPDGHWLVYDTQNDDGTWDVMISNATGAQARPVASHPADDKIPSFSRDGKWIYFSSNRGGTDEVYRVPLAGGDPVRLTESGGYAAFESTDGKAIYYSKVNTACAAPLFVRSISGGPERQVADAVCGRGFAVTKQGIYYTSGPGADGSLTVSLLDPVTGKSRDVARAEGAFYGVVHLAVSPDAGTILLAASQTTDSDLYLVENFR